MAGMSLLELVMVILLLALAAATVAGSLGGGWDGWRLRAAARELGTELRLARTAAMASGQPQRLEIDPAARTWQSSAGRRGTLPPRIDIRVTAARQLQPQAGQAAIQFFPDGASSGGQVDLRLRGVSWRVDVVWVSGEVRVWRVREAQPG